MSELVALLFGAAIVVVFAYDRFNRAGYEGSQQFERLVEFLSPDKLRARRIVLRAYMFYAATLLVIYFFLCTYAEVMPLLGGEDLLSGTIGASQIPAAPAPDAAATVATAETGGAAQTLSGPAARKDDHILGIPPSVSLTIALIIVGLAPSFPVLQRFEHWMRNTAHRLAGIPTRVVEVADSLRHSRRLDLEVPDKLHPVPADTLLIPRGDWQRMAYYLSIAETRLTSPEDFRDDLAIIFAVSAWILERKLKLSGTRDRLRFERLEGALRKRSEALIEALDEKSGYASQPDTPEATTAAAGAQTAAGGRRRGGWERLARDADDLADDLCVLLALYLEHGIIVAGSAAPRRVALAAEPEATAAESPSLLSIHQHSRAKAKLEEFLGIGAASGPANAPPQSHVMLAWLWTVGLVVAVSLAWSVFPGRLESAMQRGASRDGYLVALDSIFTGFSSFCVPMIVALAVRDAGVQSRHWGSMWSAHWTRRVPQAAFVVIISWAVATLILIPTNTWMLAAATGWETIRDSWKVLGWYFQYMGPLPLRGAVLGLIVVMLLDAQAEHPHGPMQKHTWIPSLAWASLAAVAMALVGGLTRYMSSLAAAHRFMRDSLDAIDRGLIVYAGLYSAVIGAVVVFCVAEAVLNARDKRAGLHDAGPAEVPDRVPQSLLLPVLLGLGGLLATAGPVGAAPPGAATVTIAVRIDTKPFIWKDERTGKYLGFLWDICTEAVQRAGYSFTETEVEATQRAGFLASGTGGFDLLCDPTTITLDRLANFATGNAVDLEFSPIIFAANASYLSSRSGVRSLSQGKDSVPAGCEAVNTAATPGNKTEAADVSAESDSGPPRWLARLQHRFDFRLRPDPPPPPAAGVFEIWGYVGGSTIGERLEAVGGPDGGTVRCLKPLPSHREAAEALCAGQLDRYYGDLDIIKAAVADNAAAGGACRDYKPDPAPPISYEPYALVVSARQTGFPERFALALYSMFEDGTIDRLFSSHFADSRKSPFLSTLFRLNSIPVGVEPPANSPP